MGGKMASTRFHTGTAPFPVLSPALRGYDCPLTRATMAPLRRSALDPEEFRPVSTTAPPTTNQKLVEWVDEIAQLTQPDDIHWCDGSAEEYDALCQTLAQALPTDSVATPKRPQPAPAPPQPGDAARVEDRTFICTDTPEGAGP